VICSKRREDGNTCLATPALLWQEAERFYPRFGCCSSSVVEHSLGKGEVESSILSCSTIYPWPAPMSWEAPVRFLVILAVAAFALAGCNANQGINPSGQAALCANDTGCNPYNPSSYAQNNTGHR
jgi:hypothetical protein